MRVDLLYAAMSHSRSFEGNKVAHRRTDWPFMPFEFCNDHDSRISSKAPDSIERLSDFWGRLDNSPDKLGSYEIGNRPLRGTIDPFHLGNGNAEG